MTSDPSVRAVNARPPGTSLETKGILGSSGVDDPESLKSAGRGALEIAGELKGRADTAHSLFAVAGMDFLEWEGNMSDAIYYAQDRWKKQNASLIRFCRALHEQCTETANNYSKTEEVNTRNMTYESKEQSPFG